LAAKTNQSELSLVMKPERKLVKILKLTKKHAKEMLKLRAVLMLDKTSHSAQILNWLSMFQESRRVRLRFSKKRVSLRHTCGKLLILSGNSLVM